MNDAYPVRALFEERNMMIFPFKKQVFLVGLVTSVLSACTFA